MLSRVKALPLLPRGPAAIQIAIATLGGTMGLGIYNTVLPLFLVRMAHIPVSQVGLALSIAGSAGLGAGVLAGHLADRIGSRGVLLAMYVCQAGAVILLVYAHTWAAFVLLIAWCSFAAEGGRAVRYATIARVAGAGAVRMRAQMQALSNAGLASGTALTGIALAEGTHAAYVFALFVSGVGFVSAAVAASALPALPPSAERPATDPGGAPRRSVALRDWPYVAISALNGVLALQTPLLAVGFPLLVATRHLPAFSVSAFFLTNTAMCIFLMVWAARGITDPSRAARNWRKSGVLLAAGCLVASTSLALPPWGAVLVLVSAVAIQSLGEIWYSVGGFELSLRLAPVHAQGQYQGVFNLGEGLATSVGPFLVTALCIGWGAPGWVLLATVFLVAGQSAPLVTTWALQRRATSADRLVNHA